MMRRGQSHNDASRGGSAGGGQLELGGSHAFKVLNIIALSDWVLTPWISIRRHQFELRQRLEAQKPACQANVLSLHAACL